MYLRDVCQCCDICVCVIYVLLSNICSQEMTVIGCGIYVEHLCVSIYQCVCCVNLCVVWICVGVCSCSCSYMRCYICVSMLGYQYI